MRLGGALILILRTLQGVVGLLPLRLGGALILFLRTLQSAVGLLPLNLEGAAVLFPQMGQGVSPLLRQLLLFLTKVLTQPGSFTIQLLLGFGDSLSYRLQQSFALGSGLRGCVDVIVLGDV